MDAQASTVILHVPDWAIVVPLLVFVWLFWEAHEYDKMKKREAEEDFGED